MSSGGDFYSTSQTLAGREHDAADSISADMLGDLHHLVLSVNWDRQRFVDLRQHTAGERNVYHRA